MPGNHNSVLEKPCSCWCVNSLNNLNKRPLSIKPRLPPQKCLKKLSLPGGLIEDLQYMIYDIIVFENLRFRTSTCKRKARVFKNLHSGESFWKDPVTRYVWVKPGGEYPFSDKNGYVWTGPKSFWIEKQRHWAVILSYKEWPFCIFPIFKPEPVKGLGIIWSL